MHILADIRIQTELLDQYNQPSTETELDPPVSHGQDSGAHRDVIGFRKALFTWANEDSNASSHGTSRKRVFTLRIDDEVIFKRGGFNLIVGPTGSGKTSMLMALLGGMS